MQALPQWTAQEEQTVARIMGNEKVGRIGAIQAMQRRKKAASSISQRLKLQDPLDSLVRCQKRRCLECALASGESDLETTAFLDLMLNGKERSGEYFLVQRDPAAEMVAGSTLFHGLFPVSARMDRDVFILAEESTERIELVPKEPFEPSIELTAAGIVESRVYVRASKVRDFSEKRASSPTELITAANVDGLMPVLENLASDTIPSVNPNKALRGRPQLSEEEKRSTAAQRQARWREKQREQDRQWL